MKKYQVRVTSEAKKNIEDIYGYITKKDTHQNAEYVLDKLSLRKNSGRGNYPPELSRQGIKEFKDVMFKPYRDNF